MQGADERCPRKGRSGDGACGSSARTAARYGRIMSWKRQARLRPLLSFPRRRESSRAHGGTSRMLDSRLRGNDNATQWRRQMPSQPIPLSRLVRLGGTRFLEIPAKAGIQYSQTRNWLSAQAFTLRRTGSPPSRGFRLGVAGGPDPMPLQRIRCLAWRLAWCLDRRILAFSPWRHLRPHGPLLPSSRAAFRPNRDPLAEPMAPCLRRGE